MLIIMAGTFSQMYVQVVFAVKGRHNLITKPWNEDVHKYIAGIIQGKNQKSIIVNGMPDHIHVFLGLRPSTAVSDVCGISKIIQQILLMTSNSLKENFRGRKGMVLLPIPIHK